MSGNKEKRAAGEMSEAPVPVSEALATGGLCDLYCEGCEFLAKSSDIYCDYMSVTGHSRGCPAGEGCTRRVRPPKYRKDLRLRHRVRARQAVKNRWEAERKKKQKLPQGRPWLLGNSPSLDPALRADIEHARQERARQRPEMIAQAQLISAWRSARGLTLAQAGAMMGVRGATLGQWERGNVKANWTLLGAVGLIRPQMKEET